MKKEDKLQTDSRRDRIQSEDYYSSEENPPNSSMTPPTPTKGGCGRCQKTVKDGIECNFCQRWYHGPCLRNKLKQSDIDSAVVKSVNISFKCDKCIDEGKDSHNLYLELREEMKDLRNDMMEMRKENAKLKEENAGLVKRISELESGLAGNINFEAVFTAIDEHFLRKEKKDNMVIHFLPNDSDDPEDNLNYVKDLVKESGGNPDHITEASRMGNPRDDGNPRMVKVKCKNAHTKRMLITQQGKLRQKDPNLGKFFVRDDMTDRQRATRQTTT